MRSASEADAFEMLRAAVDATRAAGTARVRTTANHPHRDVGEAWTGVCDFGAHRVHMRGGPEAEPAGEEFLSVAGFDYVRMPNAADDEPWVKLKPGSWPLDPVRHVDYLANARTVAGEATDAASPPVLMLPLPHVGRLIRRKPGHVQVPLDGAGRIVHLHYLTSYPARVPGPGFAFSDFGVEIPPMSAPHDTTSLWGSARSLFS